MIVAGVIGVDESNYPGLFFGRADTTAAVGKADCLES